MPRRDCTPLHVRVRAEKRDIDLQALGYQDYNAYLASNAWQRVKRRYVDERPWICNACGATEKLALHHRNYERVGQEHLDDLVPLCVPCHDLLHEMERRGNSGLDFTGIIDAERALQGRAFLAQLDAERRREHEERIAARRALILQQPLDVRVRLAVHAAKQRHWPPGRYRDQLRRASRCIEQRPNQALRAVEALERVVYGQPL